MGDARIRRLIDAVNSMYLGNFDLPIPTDGADEIAQLGRALQELALALDQRTHQLQKIDQITRNVNAGLLLENVLESIFTDFQDVIPFNRIGFSLIEDDGATVRAHWQRSDRPTRLNKGYAAPLAGSSLATIMETGEPRIINDLEEYLRQKPASNSTRLIVAEGIRSSLTCPLKVDGYPVGFLFFSSAAPDTYAHTHIEFFQRIAAQVSIIVDKSLLVTDLAAKTAEIEAQNEELRALNEMKNSFLGMAAHDLRSPIGNIQMALDLLVTPDFPLEQDHIDLLHKDMRIQVAYVMDLLNDLLDVSMIESGKLELALERFSMRDYLEHAVARHGQLAGPKGTTVELMMCDDGMVKADPHRLRQVVDNLISNAIKYSPPGSHVEVSAGVDGRAWEVSVVDNGPGITPQDRELLFQDFARLSAVPTGGESSTGLGLAISRRIIEAHGGEIGVESEPGQGARFWFRLPTLADRRRR